MAVVVVVEGGAGGVGWDGFFPGRLGEGRRARVDVWSDYTQ